MYLKIHETKEGIIVAVCDAELVGKLLEDKNISMDLDQYRGFYIGRRVNDTEVKKALERFSSVNIVGKKSVAAALTAGVAGKSDIRYIKQIPYIQIYRV